MSSPAESKTEPIEIFHRPHYGLRVMWNHVLHIAGCVNEKDDAAVKEVYQELEAAHALYAHHGQLEDEYWINPLIKKLGTSDVVTELVAQHHNLEIKMDALLTLGKAFVDAKGDVPRRKTARALYDALCDFIIENMGHMKFEETELTPLINKYFTPEEIRAMICNMLDEQGDKFVMASARWNLEGLNFHHRVRYLQNCKKRKDGKKLVAAMLKHLKGHIKDSEYKAIKKEVDKSA